MTDHRDEINPAAGPNPVSGIDPCGAFVAGSFRWDPSGAIRLSREAAGRLRLPAGQPLALEAVLAIAADPEIRSVLRDALVAHRETRQGFKLDLRGLCGCDLSWCAEEGDPHGLLLRSFDPEEKARRRMHERLLTRASELGSIGFWSLDLATGTLDWTDETFRIHDLETGTTPNLEEALAFYPEEARRRVDEVVRRAMTTGQPFEIEETLRTARGREVLTRSVGEFDPGLGERGRVFGLVMDVTAQRDAQAVLRAQEERWWLALSSSHAGVWDWDVEADTVFYSASWHELLGYEAGELPHVLRTWTDRLHPEDLARALNAIEASLAGDATSFQVEHRLRHRDGRFIDVVARGAIVERGRDGMPRRFVGTLTDLGPEVELRRALVAAKQHAEAAARARSEFLAVMSHELRTPLNGVLGMARVLEEEGAREPEAVMEGLAAIRESGQHLLALLSDVLDVAEIQAGRLELVDEEFDGLEEIQNAIAGAGREAARKGLSFSFHVAPEAPVRVRGDARRFRQIIQSIADNAVKFTTEGGVSVRLEGGRERSGIVLVVEDTGPGITVADRERIFDTFLQLDATDTRVHGGTGLGLPICRHLAHLMNGSIEVTSGEGEGSTFVVRLGVEVLKRLAPRAEVPPRGEGSDRAVGVPFTGMRVLVVEDNAINRRVARLSLERLGCNVEDVEDGEEGARRAADGGFDLVLMDCQMPGLDGFEATRLLRELETTAGRHTPVVALTANALTECRKRCDEAGMDGFLLKPVEPKRLAEELARWATAGDAT